MKILSIEAPMINAIAMFCIKNKKGAWTLVRHPVLFFGLVQSGSIPVGVPAEATVEPLVYNFQGKGASVATSHANYLGMEFEGYPSGMNWETEAAKYAKEQEAKPLQSGTSTTTAPTGDDSKK